MSTASANGSKLEIDYQSTFQKITGFGASDAWIIDPTVRHWIRSGNEESVEALADLLFSPKEGIGLSAWRFNIGAGSAEQGNASGIPDPYRRAELFIDSPSGELDPGKQAGQVRFLKEAHSRGVTTFVAFANSPPYWATKNGLTHPGDGTDIGSSNLVSDKAGDYSRFLVRVLSFLRGEEVKVPVNFISPANEPTWHWEDQTQEGNRYNNSDLKQLYRSLYRALEEAGLEHSVEIDGVEAPEYRVALDDRLHIKLFGQPYGEGMNKTQHGSFKNYIDEFLKDPELNNILGNKLSLHGYFSEASKLHLGPLRSALRESVAAINPAPEIWMSEYCVLGKAGDVRDFDGHGFDAADYHLAEHIARIIHRDLSELQATAWFWWLALTPYDYKDGLIKIDEELAPESLQPSKVFWVLGQYSRFIRPGYQRIDLPGFDDLHGLMASAYRSPDDDRIVIVVINSGARHRDLSLAFSGIPEISSPGLPRPYLTDEQSNLSYAPDLNLGNDRVRFPGHSVVTLDIELVANPL